MLHGSFINVWDKLPAGSTLNFGIRTSDPLLEKRLILKIEQVR